MSVGLTDSYVPRVYLPALVGHGHRRAHRQHPAASRFGHIEDLIAMVRTAATRVTAATTRETVATKTQDDHQKHSGMGSDDHNSHTVAGPSHTAMHSNAVHAEPEHIARRHPHKQTERGRHEHRGRDTEPPSHKDGTAGSRKGGDATGTSALAPDNAGSEATGTDLVIDLGLAAGLGGVGGILLRISPLG
jgi:hypothetical protein